MKYDINSIKERKKNVQLIKNIINVIIVILIYNIILVLISCMNKIEPIFIFGLRAYKITTSSMEPTIKTGDIIIIKKENENNLKKDDIITFYQKGENITHRILEINENGNRKEYITKGDNNKLKDTNRITYEDINGKFVVKIPYLGKIMEIFENKIIFLFIVLLSLLLYLYNASLQEKKEKRRNKKESEGKKK